jgi:hypothetical protein
VPGTGCLRQRLLCVAPATALRPGAQRSDTHGTHPHHPYSRATYGAPRIHQELPAADIHVGRKPIARLMNAAGLAGLSRRKWMVTIVRDQNAGPAPDLLERNFVAPAPDCLWVADITYIPTWSGLLYLAVVLDAFNRRIVGQAMATHRRTALVLEALNLAIGRRRPAAVIHHSEHGSQGRFKRSSQIGMTIQKRRSDRSGRAALRSPGRPPLARRENYQQFWAAVAASRSSKEAAIDAGVSPAVGGRWFRRAVACHRHIFYGLQSPYRAVSYRLPSAKRSPSCGFRSTEFAPLLTSSGGLLQRSRASCAGMLRHAAADWNIGPPPRNGMLIARCAAPKQPSWRGMKRSPLRTGPAFRRDHCA